VEDLVSNRKNIMTKWISIKKEMPPEGSLCLVYSPNHRGVKDVIYISIKTPESFEFVTHWMPLPEPPNKQD